MSKIVIWSPLAQSDLPSPSKLVPTESVKTLTFTKTKMKRSKFTETQIDKALKEHENGRKIEEIT